MNDVSNLLKKSLGKEMTSAMASNYASHGDTDSVSDFAMATNSVKKEVQEDGEKGWSPQVGKTDGLTSSTLTKILSKIAKDLDDEVDEKPTKEEPKEATTSSSSGAYDAPFGGPKKDPLSLDTPKNVYSKLRSVTDKNFPRYGGKGGTYVKIKDKCKKFPYCNQGDVSALEFFENDIIKEAIKRVSKRHNLDSSFIKGVIMERLNK